MVILGARADDNLGSNLNAPFGDISGDGIPEFLMGNPFGDGPAGARASCGELYVIPGGSPLPATLDLLSAGVGHSVIYGAEAGDDLAVSQRVGTGDFNGDGVQDVIVGSYASGPANARLECGEASVLYGSSSSASATVRRTAIATNPLPLDFDTARAAIDYSSGSGGPLTTVTLHRNTTGITQFPAPSLAGGHWEVGTSRTGFSATVALRYLDSEVAGMTESALRVYRAASIGGTYTLVPSQTLDTVRNTIKFTTTTFSDFVIVDTSTGVGDWAMFD